MVKDLPLSKPLVVGALECLSNVLNLMQGGVHMAVVTSSLAEVREARRDSKGLSRAQALRMSIQNDDGSAVSMGEPQRREIFVRRLLWLPASPKFKALVEEEPVLGSPQLGSVKTSVEHDTEELETEDCVMHITETRLQLTEEPGNLRVYDTMSPLTPHPSSRGSSLESPFSHWDEDTSDCAVEVAREFLLERERVGSLKLTRDFERAMDALPSRPTVQIVADRSRTVQITPGGHEFTVLDSSTTTLFDTAVALDLDLPPPEPLANGIGNAHHDSGKPLLSEYNDDSLSSVSSRYGSTDTHRKASPPVCLHALPDKNSSTSPAKKDKDKLARKRGEGQWKEEAESSMTLDRLQMGRALGVVTLEDVFEALIQEEIYDEKDIKKYRKRRQEAREARHKKELERKQRQKYVNPIYLFYTPHMALASTADDVKTDSRL